MQAKKRPLITCPPAHSSRAKRRALFISALIAAPLPLPAARAVLLDTYKGTNGSNFNAAGNWLMGVPSTSGIGYADQGSAGYTADLSASLAIGEFEVQTDNITLNLNSYTFTLNNSVGVAVGVIAGGSTDSLTVEDGTLNASAGAVDVNTNPSAPLASLLLVGATVEANILTVGNAASTLPTHYTYQDDANSTTTVTNALTVAEFGTLTNYGTVSAGTLPIGFGGTVNVSGSIHVGAATDAGILNILTDGSFTCASLTLTGTGSAILNGGTATVSGVTLPSTATFTFNGGTLHIIGTDAHGNGLTINSSDPAAFLGDNVTLSATQTLTAAGVVDLADQNAAFIMQGGVLNIPEITNTGGGHVSITGASTGSFTVTGMLPLSASGPVGKTMIIGSGMSVTAGTLALEDGTAALTVEGGDFTATHLTTVTGATATLIGGYFTVTDTPIELGAGALVAGAVSVVLNSNTIPSNSALTGLSVTIDPATSVILNGALTGLTGVTLGGTLTLNGSGTITNSGTNPMLNDGVINLHGSITSAAGFTNNGTVTGGGILHAAMKNDGIIAPGDPAIFTVDGDFSQPTGTLIIDIAGTSSGLAGGNNGYDQVRVNGNITLGGTLEIDFLNGFVPSDPSDQYPIMVSTADDAPTGSFSNEQGNLISTNLGTFEVVVSGNQVLLEDFQPSVPEPASLALFAMGAFGLLRRKRGNRDTTEGRRHH